MDIEQALQIACQAHWGQKDKCGEPYILHPVFVMTQMETEDEKVVAILHDVIEDTGITMNQLCKAGLTDIQMEALRYLTHENNEPYKDYIRCLTTNDIARIVKIQDLIHNMQLDRIEKSLKNGADKTKMERKQSLYMWAFHYLTTGIDFDKIEKI